MIVDLLAIALATLVSEDLTCIATGVLIAQGKLGFIEGSVACLAGIFVGDTLLLLAGRLAGKSALTWPMVSRFVPPHLVERGTSWLQEKGLIVVLLSRFTPGLRLPTYFAAGLLPTRLSSFITYFFIASAIWTPLVIAGVGVLGEKIILTIFASGQQGLMAFFIVSGVITVLAWLLRRALSFPVRRRLVGFLKRKANWEFWPSWAAYIPLVPYLLYLAIRYRSLTLFTAANPGIPSGGFVGESKSEILSHFSLTEGAVAEYALIPAGLNWPCRVIAARNFMIGNDLTYPVVLKPDVGERGAGVAIVRNQAELEAYLRCSLMDTIIQSYVPGFELGVFYCRHPRESRGRVISITEKLFPVVQGDGKSSLRELILRDSRAVCIAATYEQLSKRSLDEILAAGETVQLVELGSHCRGAVFLDGGRLKTPALEEAIDRLSKAHPGFFFGRFDIRTPSLDAFRKGHSFKVIELNGVSAEAAHIYDPSIGLAEAYRVMFRQWKLAFDIGAANRDRGVEPMSLQAFIRLLVKCASGPRSMQETPRA
jgi:membrane protein DedA with SNARE-associated domain